MVTAGVQLCNSGEKAGIRDNRDWEGKKSKWETKERAYVPTGNIKYEINLSRPKAKEAETATMNNTVLILKPWDADVQLLSKT